MRGIFAALACAFCIQIVVCGAEQPNPKPAEEAKEIEIFGELIQVEKYLSASKEEWEKNKDDWRKECIESVRKGAVMGVLTEDGKIYVLLSVEHKKETELTIELAGKIGRSVTVKGTVREGGGVRGIHVVSWFSYC